MKRKILKITFLGLITAIIFLSCGGLSPLAPPEWIIGSWSDEFYIINWAFTSDNAVFSTSGTPIDLNEIAKQKDVDVTDNQTASTYMITQSIGGVETSTYKFTYKFEKLTSTTLNFSMSVSGIVTPTEPIVLYKE
jgi:hypothetical protein